jgi:hypothetical protein
MQKHTTVCVIAFLSAFMAGASTASATPLLSENFNGFTGVSWQGAQYQQPASVVGIGGTLTGWTVSGWSNGHVLDRDTTGNYAVEIFTGPSSGQRNVVSLTTGIAANSLGITYAVSFDFSPTTFNNTYPGATTAGDKLVFNVITGSSTVLATYQVTPGAWSGSMNWQAGGFSYIGNGGGDVRYQFTSLNDGTSVMAGAVDNFSVSAIPEPSTYALLGGLGALAFAAMRRRRHVF